MLPENAIRSGLGDAIGCDVCPCRETQRTIKVKVTANRFVRLLANNHESVRYFRAAWANRAIGWSLLNAARSVDCAKSDRATLMGRSPNLPRRWYFVSTVRGVL